MCFPLWLVACILLSTQDREHLTRVPLSDFFLFLSPEIKTFASFPFILFHFMLFIILITIVMNHHRFLLTACLTRLQAS